MTTQNYDIAHTDEFTPEQRAEIAQQFSDAMSMSDDDTVELIFNAIATMTQHQLLTILATAADNAHEN